MSNKLKHFFLVYFIPCTLLMFFLLSCGGGKVSDGGIDRQIYTGIIDTPVKGLKYFTLTQSGITTEKGEFKYRKGEKVSFLMDRVELGKVSSRKNIYISEFRKPLDIAVFLQTLDIDNTNLIDVTGVNIPANVQQIINSYLENNDANSDLDFNKVFTQGLIDNIQQANPELSFVTDEIVSRLDAYNKMITFKETTSLDDISGNSYYDQNNGKLFKFTKLQYDGGYEDYGSHDVRFEKIILSLSYGERSGVDAGYVRKVELNLDGNVLLVGRYFDPDFVEEYGRLPCDLPSGNCLDLPVSLNSLQTYYKVRPIKISDLMGKTLKLAISEKETECTSRSMTFSNTSLLVKTVCNGIKSDYNYQISDDGLYEGVIACKLDDSYTSYPDILLYLAEGNLEKGKIVLEMLLVHLGLGDIYEKNLSIFGVDVNPSIISFTRSHD